LVLPTIGGTIGAQGDIGASIGEKRMLLVLDNFEQLLDARTDVAGILSYCANLQLLATSREPLNVAAEREYRVPPMTEADAVTLFDERAVEAASSEATADLCRRLDCLPLALELAAARTKGFTFEQILSRLDDRLSFLSGGPHDAPARQQTLKATIEWSYDLLTPDEQRVFDRLGVFAGGCDLAGAEAVCGADCASAPLPDRVVSLIEKSLISREPDLEGEPRYSMLDTIRSYALERLRQTGELETVQQRHAAYLLALLERADRLVTGEETGGDTAADDRLTGELPNLRGLLTFSLGAGELEQALRLAGAGRWLWGRSGAMIEAQAWMTRVLDLTEHMQTPDRARVLLSLGECEFTLGDAHAAARRYEEARDLYERCDDRRGALQAVIASLEMGKYAEDLDVEALLEAARSLADESGSDLDRARILLAAAAIESRAGEFDRAEVLLDEGIELMRTVRMPFRLWAWQLVNAGHMALDRQDSARARRFLEEYLAASAAKPPIGTAIAHSALGLAALYDNARDSAAQHFREALMLAHGRGAKDLAAECLYGTAAVAAMDSDPERAARLRGAADGLKERTSMPLSTPERFVVEQYLRPLEAELGPDVDATARAEGAAMSPDEAIEYALGGVS
jgi:predicted ATPase